MSSAHPKQHGASGMTLIEILITAGTLMVLMLATVTALIGSQNAFVQSQTLSVLQLRSQIALDRIVALASQAVTGDAEFSPLKPTTGVDSHGLRFRLIESIDGVSGVPVYNDALKVYVYGPDSGANPSAGLIIGRGPDLTDIYTTGAGADNLLGTVDDGTAAISGGVPAVELLIPSTFAPQTGDMFRVNVTPAPTGRLLTFTLRLNAREADGDFVLANDLVLTTTVALRE
jgi:type II secretory pathway pseudopilin PulG